LIEKAYVTNNIKDLTSLPEDANRIYSGSEYCIKAFPTNFTKLIKEVKKQKPLSLLTPPIIESELPLFYKYFAIFENFASEEDELIINDWGILHYVTKNKKTAYKLRLGRFLTYQKRGTQKRNNLVDDTSLSAIPILEKQTVKYLANLGVTGVDIDIPLYKVKLDEPVELNLAICLPYALNSYTINCPFTFNGSQWGRRCKRECINLKMLFSNEEVEEPFFQRGKAYYTMAHLLDLPYISRIVHFEWKR